MAGIDFTHIYGSKAYKGKWVAVINYKTKPKVVVSAKSLKEAMELAEKKGYKLPLLMHIPKKILPFVGGFSLLSR
jgi:hypothetical protein